MEVQVLSPAHENDAIVRMTVREDLKVGARRREAESQNFSAEKYL